MKRLIKKLCFGLHRFITSFKLRIAIALNDKGSEDVSLFRRLILNIKGFQSDKWILYNLKNNNIKEYLSDYQRWKGRLINGPYNITMDDKLLSLEIFDKYTPFPRNIGYIKEKLIFSEEKQSSITTDELLNILNKNGKLVLKPINGSKGEGVYILSVDDNIYYLNGQAVSISQMKNTINALNEYWVTEFAKQHEYAEKLYKNTTNTIRIITMRNPNNESIFIPVALQRIGNKRSIPVDNWGKGGFSALINIDTGIIESSAAGFDSKSGLKFYDIHPESGHLIKGIKIPNWDLIKKQTIHCHTNFPAIHFIAWDVVVNQDSFCVVELNASTDFDLFQVHMPLLSDQRIKDFYKYHGLV